MYIDSRFVYRFYRGVFNITMGIAAFGYGLFLVNVFAFPNATMVDASLTLVFYGLYFGVLSRDLIDYCADVMASTIGVFKSGGSSLCSITARKVFPRNNYDPIYVPSVAIWLADCQLMPSVLMKMATRFPCYSMPKMILSISIADMCFTPHASTDGAYWGKKMSVLIVKSGSI
jgi:hypothetical protein